MPSPLKVIIHTVSCCCCLLGYVCRLVFPACSQFLFDCLGASFLDALCPDATQTLYLFSLDTCITLYSLFCTEEVEFCPPKSYVTSYTEICSHKISCNAVMCSFGGKRVCIQASTANWNSVVRKYSLLTQTKPFPSSFEQFRSSKAWIDKGIWVLLYLITRLTWRLSTGRKHTMLDTSWNHSQCGMMKKYPGWKLNYHFPLFSPNGVLWPVYKYFCLLQLSFLAGLHKGSYGMIWLNSSHRPPHRKQHNS